MSAEAMPKLAPEEHPASEKRSRRKKNDDASNVIPLASLAEQLDEVEAADRGSESEEETPRHSGIFVSERRHTSDVEQEHEERSLISLHEERDAWQRELDRLEGNDERSVEDRKRCEALRSRIERVALIEERAKEVEAREKTEERMKEVDRDLETERERLKAVESERERAEEERAKRAEDIRNDRKRIDALNRDLRANPTDEKKAEIAKISQHLEEARSEMEGRDLKIRDLRHEESSARAKVKDKVRVLDVFAAAAAASSEKVAELTSKAAEKDVAIEEMENAEPEKPRSDSQKKDKGVKAKKKASSDRGNSLLGTMGIGVGIPLAIGAGAIAAGGRLFKTFFSNIYKLSMNPGKFFSELESKYASAMEDPPKGKGAVRGFLSGTKWLFIGDAPPKKSKTK